MTAALRSAAIVLYERPCADPASGTCRWCGEPIVLVDPTDYRRARRERHYGDKHEAGERRDCRGAFLGSVVWNARSAVRWRESRAHDGVIACVDCGQVCDAPTLSQGVYWEADHEVPLIDGGAHELDNLRCRCGPCHGAKTARESAERAARRRATRHDQLPFSPASALNGAGEVAW